MSLKKIHVKGKTTKAQYSRHLSSNSQRLASQFKDWRWSKVDVSLHVLKETACKQTDSHYPANTYKHEKKNKAETKFFNLHKHAAERGLNRYWERRAPRVTQERNLRSKIWWFTEFCNSHYVSHFAAFFIVARTKISIAKSCNFNVQINKRVSNTQA